MHGSSKWWTSSWEISPFCSRSNPLVKFIIAAFWPFTGHSWEERVYLFFSQSLSRLWKSEVSFPHAWAFSSPDQTSSPTSASPLNTICFSSWPHQWPFFCWTLSILSLFLLHWVGLKLDPSYGYEEEKERRVKYSHFLPCALAAWYLFEVSSITHQYISFFIR